MSNSSFSANIEKIAFHCKTLLNSGGKIIFAGNGGSASDSAHMAAELVSRLRLNRSAIPALALGTNISTISAWANDYDYATGLARELEAVGTSKDILIMLSTSGKSENIQNLALAARSLGIVRILISGESPSIPSDFVINIPNNRTERIQELYMLLLHTICEFLELP
jgi:D-sedoheptulose 7-phosphate isomerase